MHLPPFLSISSSLSELLATMSERGRSSKCSKNNLSLILHAAEVIDSTDTAHNSPGPSGMSDKLTALPDPQATEFTETYEQSIVAECYQECSGVL